MILSKGAIASCWDTAGISYMFSGKIGTSLIDYITKKREHRND